MNKKGFDFEVLMLVLGGVVICGLIIFLVWSCCSNDNENKLDGYLHCTFSDLNFEVVADCGCNGCPLYAFYDGACYFNKTWRYKHCEHKYYINSSPSGLFNQTKYMEVSKEFINVSEYFGDLNG